MKKIVVIISLFYCLTNTYGQGSTKSSENLIHYNDRWIHYGFMIGVHSSKYVTEYSQKFVDKLDSIHSIIPGNTGGFKIGFLANMKIARNLDFSGSFTVGFYEYSLNYRYTDLREKKIIKEAATLEIPLLLKYKSLRRGNIAAYLLTGINPKLDVRNKLEDELNEKLETNRFDIALEVGAGLDIYFKLFKFSPEIRYSHGLTNILKDKNNSFGEGLRKITTHNIALFMTFEGSPTDSKRATSLTKGRKQRRRKKRKKNN